MSDNKTVSFEEAKEYIDAIDFSQIIDRLVREKKWSNRSATIICEMYRKFLLLSKKSGNKYRLVPTQQIDEVWHNHILFTKQYENDCQLIFGYYLHHYPTGAKGATSGADLEQRFTHTQVLHKQMFGQEMLAVRIGKCVDVCISLLEWISNVCSKLRQFKFNKRHINSQLG